MRGRLLVALLTAAAALAGCADPEEAAPAGTPYGAVAPAELAAGAFYALPHEGGDLDFLLEGRGHAWLTLYGPDDLRLGSVELGGDAPPSARFLGVAAGSEVLFVQELNGTLAIRSGGVPVPGLWALPTHLERYTLAQVSAAPFPFGPLFGSGPVDAAFEVNLTRTPALLRLLATHTFQGLRVQAIGGLGPILQAEAAGGEIQGLPLLPSSGQFAEVPGRFYPENVVDARLNVTLHADELQGAILLESWSFSRALARAPQLELAPPASAGFLYGALPEGPVLFQVHDRATALRLRLEGNGTANETAPGRVAIYGPDDARLGVVTVPPGVEARVPVAGGGAYVAVAYAGTVLLGADRAPADFELHPLETWEEHAPPSTAGNTGDYGQESMDLQPSGVLFDVRPEWIGPAFPLPAVNCPEEGMLALDQDGETLGYRTSQEEHMDRVADLLSGSAGLRLRFDGFGSQECGHPGVLLASYLRPTA